MCQSQRERDGQEPAEREKVHWFDRFDITPSGRITVLLLFSCCAGANVSCRGTELSRGWNTKENGGSWENLAKSRETRSIIHPTQDWEDVNVCDGSPLVNTQPRRASERERVRVLWCCVRPMREKEKKKKKTSGIYWGRPLRPKQQHTQKKAISPPKKRREKQRGVRE